MKYQEVKLLLVESLLESFPQAEGDEIEAMISHWLQTQYSNVLNFTDSMKDHCISALKDTKLVSVKSKRIRHPRCTLSNSITGQMGQYSFSTCKKS